MKKILLVEDNSHLSKLKNNELKEHLPYLVIIAKSLHQMKEIIREYESDIFIALLDCQLDVTETCDTVEYLYTKSIPTIVYDDKFSNDLREEVLAYGALEYLLKKENSDLLYSMRLIDRVYKNSFIKAIIVDGSERFRDELSVNLKQFGLVSMQTSDANSTMQLLDQHPDVRIILIDEDFKGITQGVDLVEDIRIKYPSDQLVILGMSPHGYNSKHSIEFLKKGANDFIIKPSHHANT